MPRSGLRGVLGQEGGEDGVAVPASGEDAAETGGGGTEGHDAGHDLEGEAGAEAVQDVDEAAVEERVAEAEEGDVAAGFEVERQVSAALS